LRFQGFRVLKFLDCRVLGFKFTGYPDLEGLWFRGFGSLEVSGYRNLKDFKVSGIDRWILRGGDRAPARGPRFGLIVLEFRDSWFQNF
jgi:hypothetical protein